MLEKRGDSDVESANKNRHKQKSVRKEDVSQQEKAPVDRIYSLSSKVLLTLAKNTEFLSSFLLKLKTESLFELCVYTKSMAAICLPDALMMLMQT